MSSFRNIRAMIQANLVLQVAGAFRGLIVKRILGPQATGLYVLMQLLLGYVQFFNLGAPTAAGRELPYRHGKREYQLEDRIRSTLFASAFIESGLAAVLFYVYLLLAYDTGSATFWILAPVPVFALIIKLITAFIICLESLHQFIFISRIYAITAICDFFIKITAAYFWGLPGIMVGFGLVLLINLILCVGVLYRKPLFRFKPKLHRRQFRSLLKLGIPLEIAAYGEKIYHTLDSLVVTLWLGTTALANYSIGTALFIQLAELPTKVSNVLIPKLMENFGRSNDLHCLQRDIFRFLIGNLLVGIPPVCAIGFFGGEWLIRTLLPEFKQAIPVLQILLFGSFFIPQKYVLNVLFVIKKQLLRNILIVLSGICILAASIGWFALRDPTIEAVATATVIGYGLHFAVLLPVATFRIFTWKLLIKVFLLQGACLVYSYLLLHTIKIMLPPASSLMLETLYTCLRTFLAIILLTPFATWGLKEIEVWEDVKATVLSKLALKKGI